MLRDKRLSAYAISWEDYKTIRGGVEGASGTRRSTGTITLDMMANRRILEIGCHVDILKLDAD
jgi:hypothetical protein